MKKKSLKINKKRKNFLIKFKVIKNKGYGALRGSKIYYEGKRPRGLKRDGSITFGKHVLETLKSKLDKPFRWIITEEIDSISIERNIYRVRTSQKTLKLMGSELWDRTRDIKIDIVTNIFSIIYPRYFGYKEAAIYVPGAIARILGGNILPRLSTDDREAINDFLPDYMASESLNTINIVAETQIKTLKGLAADMETAIDAGHTENWWQKYVKKNILIIQQGYISAIEKINTVVGGVKFPDFAMVTHDGYLDILEIKRPNTPLLKYDQHRDNYYWDAELSKAIIQTENYIENVQHSADSIRNYIRDKYKIDLKVIRPRGIILAGDTRKMNIAKEKDDFRLLSLSAKNIVFVTYDELLSRLKNYIKVLEERSK